jgi:hypothetical protein
MQLGLLFWIIMIIVLIFGGGMWMYPANPYFGRGFPFITWICLAILGWAVFGPAIHA